LNGKTLLLVAGSKEQSLALAAQDYLASLGAESLIVGAAREATKVLRTRPDVCAVVVIGDAALTSSDLLGWRRLFRPHLPCCVIGTERRHLAACAGASGHFLMRETSQLEMGRVVAFLRGELNRFGPT
jgi:hypothetical protein